MAIFNSKLLVITRVYQPAGTAMEQPVDVRTPSQGCVAQGALDGQALGVIIPCSKVTEKSGKSGEILW